MRITHEADYAVRIVYVLMQDGGTVSARNVSEKTGVTLRFTLKILNKLSTDGIVTARKGSSGGYTLSLSPNDLSLGQIIECIDGPFELNHCLSDDFPCTRVGDKNLCRFHKLFDQLNGKFKDELYAIKMSDYIEKTEE